MNGYAIQQSTAGQPLVFLMIDSSDHVSGKTGLTPTVTISKNGGAFASPAGGVTEIGSGLYAVAANATDSNTLGPLVLHATATGADPTDWLYPVVAYDPLTVAVGALQPMTAGRKLLVSATSGKVTAEAVELDSAARVKLDGTQPDYAPLLASGYTTPPTTGAIADAVLTESILDHRNVANSLAKFIWQIRQANLTIDGTVSNAITPTTLTFSSNIAATTSAYAHAVLLFVTGPLAGENSPIISYNSTNGVFLLEEALTAAPSSGDEFVVIAGSHVHSVADIQSGLATSAALAAAKTILDKVDSGLVIDGAVYQFTANMLELGPAGGGGGDATLAKQDEILAAIQGVDIIQVASPNVSGNLVLTQGDDYDGTANPRAQWNVTADYTDGWSVTLTIRDADDAVIYTTAGAVVSTTVIAVTIAAPTGLTMTGCPGQWQGKFDVQLSKAGKKKTIALGVCYINEDQTR